MLYKVFYQIYTYLTKYLYTQIRNVRLILEFYKQLLIN